MSIRVMNIVWEHSKADGSLLLMLLAIADFADDSGTAYPRKTRLADKTRQTPRTVQRLTQKLEESKELKIIDQAGPGGSNVYQIQIANLLKNSRHFIEDHPGGGDKMSPPRTKKGLKGETFRASGPINHEPSLITVINTHHVFSDFPTQDGLTNSKSEKTKKGGGSESNKFALPNVTEFITEWLGDSIDTWLEQNCPAVSPQTAIEEFFKYHKSEKTEFTNRNALMAAWRGWMRKAQKLAVEKSERRAARKEMGNGRNSESDSTSAYLRKHGLL